MRASGSFFAAAAVGMVEVLLMLLFGLLRNSQRC
jgi:hypothetical protein